MVKREGLPFFAIVADDVDHAVNAQHQLHAPPVRVLAAFGAERRAQRKHPRDSERNIGHCFGDHDFAIGASVPWQLNGSNIGDTRRQWATPTRPKEAARIK